MGDAVGGIVRATSLVWFLQNTVHHSVYLPHAVSACLHVRMTRYPTIHATIQPINRCTQRYVAEL